MKCQKNLVCGHVCCGIFEENCPDICGKCLNQNTKNMDLVFSFECGHYFEITILDDFFKDCFRKNPNLSIDKIPCLTCNKPIGKNFRYQDYYRFSITEIKNMEDLTDFYLSKFEILTKELIEFLKEDRERLRKKKSDKKPENLSHLASLLFNFDQKIKMALKFGHLLTLKFLHPKIFKEIKLQSKPMRKIISEFTRIEIDFFKEELDLSIEGWQSLDKKIQEIDNSDSISLLHDK